MYVQSHTFGFGCVTFGQFQPASSGALASSTDSLRRSACADVTCDVPEHVSVAG